MKSNKLYIALLLSVVCIFSSCLDEDPKYTLNNVIVFETEDNMEQALLGCYGYMTTSNGYGQMWQEIPIAASGLSWSSHGGSDTDKLASLDMLYVNSMPSYSWNGMYKVIAEVNAFLEGAASSPVVESIRNQKTGEAKSLRALAYYNLVCLYGDVPLRTSASSSDGISAPRVPTAEIFQFIINDLKDAEEIAATSKVGRFNSWAVKAFLGKVYYKMATLDINKNENLQNAKLYFDEVYSSGIYQLEPSFSGLFGSYVNTSKEAIIQFNFTTSSTISFNRAANRFAPPTSTTGISWGTYSPLKATYDLHYGTYPDDPRLEVNFLTRYRTRTGNSQANPKPQVGDNLSPNDSTYTYPYLTYSVDEKNAVDSDYIYKNGQKTTSLKKYVAVLPYNKFPNKKNPSLNIIENYNDNPNPLYNKAIQESVIDNFAKSGSQTLRPWYGKMFDQNQVGIASNKNLMVYRYAEMLLLMADVYNELGYTGEAIGFVNQVLDRARNSDGASSLEPQAWSTSLSKDEVKEKLYFERIIELMGEPSMFDVTRQGGIEMLRKLLELNNQHEITGVSFAQYNVTRNGWLDTFFNIDPASNVANLTEDFLRKNLLLPIPSSEISANPGINQNDNNYGY